MHTPTKGPGSSAESSRPSNIVISFINRLGPGTRLVIGMFAYTAAAPSYVWVGCAAMLALKVQRHSTYRYVLMFHDTKFNQSTLSKSVRAPDNPRYAVQGSTPVSRY
jgi:hypothetical protein